MRRAYKRPLDLAILLSAHLLLAPVWLLVWILVPAAVWLEDRGPVFYRQRRVGYKGREFNVLKFRTMVPDAEKHTGPVWAARDDVRVTKVGRILRKTALDELPQVINILRGDMSFVGPRSERPELHAKFVREIPDFEKRLAVRPGLTGAAQVNGAYDLPPAEKLKYDLGYIDRMSLWTDCRLVFLSIAKTLSLGWDRRGGKN
ncbi:MAG: sugar transferase [Chloroflexi bacterium]|nr:sugar transferase [Chloroflexota bacterium]